MTTEFQLTDELLEKINTFSRKKLSASEVYTFPVILCDNEIDRDNERFSIPALKKLSQLFVGKTGIFDHDPKGSNQSARIFDACIMQDASRTTRAGEVYTALVAKAYMIRTASNADLIAEIDGGIKKEVSVGCSVSRRRCSVCGSDRSVNNVNAERKCRHIKGKSYGGRLCHTILDEPQDAYEWSFVAVPAQPGAGVSKTMSSEYRSGEHEKAQLQAKNELIAQIIRRSWLTDPRLSRKQYKEYLESLDICELSQLKRSLKECDTLGDTPCLTGRDTLERSKNIRCDDINDNYKL